MSSELAWQRMTLKDAGVSLIDCDHRTPPHAEEGYPYIAIPQLKNGHIKLEGVRLISKSDYLDWTKKLKPQENDVIVVRRCNSGDSAVVPRGLECAIGQNLVILRADGATVNPKFLRWLIRGPDWWEQVKKFINVGAVFDSLKCREIPRYELPIPPLEQQKEIATILGALDDRIELLRETNTTLEAIAQTLFKSWFVDFDPVHAKQQGRKPEGMDAVTAALFPDSFEESELGLVPKGWRVAPLSEICSLHRGCSYKGDGLSEHEGAFMFNLGCFNAPRVFATERIKRYTGKYRDQHSVSAGDLIVANTDMTQDRAILGRPLIVPNGVEPGFISHHVFKVEPKSESHLGIKTFLFFAFLQPTFRERAVGYATGTTVLALPKEAFQMHQLVLPDNNQIHEFANIVGLVMSSIELNLQKIETLSTIRDTLLPRLISGQLRLPEAQDTDA